ncbi:gliding motility-associated C-terminal domain-containing protein [Mongoliibacter ruber]|uniref:CHU domain-containing protein n=1 Tax=Mongoliibacter ruber TaxID=1750599 RepID=A0A2T0WFG1_9BACT|nr:gliding motility-associated C-terminal domain-containing protein [Mongoliibacter ruber]PRY85439.1 CHU domain-containing protein [Mongoliibacter ruber]
MKKRKNIFPIKFLWLTACLLMGIFGAMLSAAIHEKSTFLEAIGVNEVEILGPERVCLVGGNKIEEYIAGGDFQGDRFSWSVTLPDGTQRIFSGSESFIRLPFTFSQPGLHIIQLTVSRVGSGPVGAPQIKEVLVLPGAEIALQPSYTICQGDGILLKALATSTADLNDYSFEWKDNEGNLVGDENTLFVDEEGDFTVSYSIINSNGDQECENTLSTSIKNSAEFDLIISQTNYCPGNDLIANTDPQVQGRWYYEKEGESKVFISQGNAIQYPTGNLPGFGNYKLIFELINESNPDCEVREEVSFIYGPFPAFVIEEEVKASECFEGDGVLTIIPLSQISQISLVIDEDNSIVIGTNLEPGVPITVDNLKSGVYTFEAFLNGCRFTQASVVNLEDIPDQLKFSIDPASIVPETCAEDGVNPGSFTVVFESGPVDVKYELYFKNGGLAKQGELKSQINDVDGTLDENDTEFTIEVLGGGYYFEVFLPEDDFVVLNADDDEEERCYVPFIEEFEVPGLPQVRFSAPREFSFCESYELTPTTDQPLEFELRLVGSTEPSRFGETFIIEEPGDYELIGRHTVLPDEICPRIIELKIDKVEPVIFEPKLVDLVCSTGAQTWEVEIDNYSPAEVDIRWYDEEGDLVSSLTTMSPAEFGMYTVDIQPKNILGSCDVDPYEFEVPDLLNLSVGYEKSQLCPFGPDATITLDAIFDFVGRIRWRYSDENGEIFELTDLEDETEITISQSGVYEATLYSSINIDCELGNVEIEVDISDNLTQFDVPEEELVVCESYEWIPDSNFPLNYILTYPDGKEEIASSSELFVLDQTGEYLIRGEDPSNPICPNEKTFDVRVVQPIVFTAEKVGQTCAGEFTYAANFSPGNVNEVEIRWRDATGTVLSEDLTFSTFTPGTYTLEVQPAGSIPCDVDFEEILIEAPVLSVDVSLQAGIICPDDLSTLIVLEVDLQEEVDRIEWYFTDPDGNTESLNQYEDLYEAVADREGTYEVIVYNRLNCPIGDYQALILRSMDDVRPEVKDVYEICAEYEIGETINPGNFSNYTWYLEDAVVSTNPTFKPQVVGEYTLIVNSMENCEYVVTFEVEEECELRIAHPNAIIPGDSERNFLIFSNYLVDELDIWIFNKWGQEVFTCSETNIQSNTAFCIWDGYYRGEKIPIGSYAVRIYYKNTQEGIEETQMTTLTVIE